MNRLDRYILVTAGGAFIAVILCLTGIVWLTTALRRFDLLTSQSQTVWVFLSITGLSLPTVMIVIAPIALFIAIIFTFFKLNSDSELIVMSAAGMSPWRLFRAPLAFSIAVAAVTAVFTVDLGPRSLQGLRHQLSLVNADIVTNVAIPGRFTTIERGLTFHVRERGPGGQLIGIFINDSRNPQQITTYLAERGRIVSTRSGLLLVLENGTLHRGSEGGQNSSIVAIERYAFDLSQIDQTVNVNLAGPSFMSLFELLLPEQPVSEAERGRHRLELHKRLSSPLYPIAAFVIAFAFLGSPRTTRQSRGIAIAGAGACFLIVEVTGLGSGGFVESSALAAPLPYLMPLAAIGLGLAAILNTGESRVPAWLQRIADGIMARVERATTT
jgi:lipopolysaccharide export system permease protein